MDFNEKTGCFCCTFAIHFSVYTVADKGVAASSADQQIVNAQAVSSKVKSDVGTNAASEIAQEKAAEKEPEKAGVASKLGDMAEKAGVGGIIGGVVATLCLIAAIAAVVVHKKRKQRLCAQSAGGSVFEIAVGGMSTAALEEGSGSGNKEDDRDIDEVLVATKRTVKTVV
jgi:hypothetical protein